MENDNITSTEIVDERTQT